MRTDFVRACADRDSLRTRKMSSGTVPGVRVDSDCSLVDPSLSTLALCNVPSCCKVLRKPHLTMCCGQNICLSCRERSQRCPVTSCGRPDEFGAAQNHAHMQNLLEYEVLCGNRGRGCTWRGKLGLYDETHLRECEFVQTKCEYCGKCVEGDQVEIHSGLCPMFPVQCPNGCQMTLVRQDLSEHKLECRLELIQCPFVAYNCCTRTHLRRMECTEHLNSAIHAHFEAVKESGLWLQSQWKNLDKRLSRHQSRHEAVMAEKEGEVADLKRQLQKATLKLDSLKDQLQLVEDNTASLSENTHRTKEDFTAEINVTQQQQLDRLKAGAQRLRTMVVAKSYGPPLPRTLVPYMNSQPHIHYNRPPFDITVTNFQQMRANNEKWTSPPLYSQPGGYKFCITVYPCGCSSGSHAYVSVYAKLLESENDEYLQWPFSGKINLCLLSKLGQPTLLKKTILMDRSCDVRFRQMATSAVSVGEYGLDMFLEQRIVASHLCNDSMLLRVNIIMSPM